MKRLFITLLIFTLPAFMAVNAQLWATLDAQDDTYIPGDVNWSTSSPNIAIGLDYPPQIKANDLSSTSSHLLTEDVWHPFGEEWKPAEPGSLSSVYTMHKGNSAHPDEDDDYDDGTGTYGNPENKLPIGDIPWGFMSILLLGYGAFIHIHAKRKKNQAE